MPLHTKQPHGDPSTVAGRASQFASFMEHIWGTCNQIVQSIDGGGLTYLRLAQLAEQLRSTRNFIASSTGVNNFGNLKSLEVRQFLAEHDSPNYPDAASIVTMLQDLDAALITMNQAYRVLIEGREGAGGISTNSSTEMLDDAPFVSPETDILRAAAESVKALFERRTFINGQPV